MKRLIVAICLFSAPVAAQSVSPLPITLSPQEYDAIITALIQRDPVLGTLVAKQRDAQQSAAAQAKAPPPPADK